MDASFYALSDEQLVDLIIKGDQNAFADLLERYRRMMLAKTANMPQVGLDSDDFMQECALALMDAVKGYNHEAGASFASYAHRCVSNRINSALRKANTDKRRALQDYTELNDSSMATSDGDPAAQILAKEEAEELRRLMLKLLSPTEKAVFQRYLEGDSYTAIGEALGIDHRAVDNAIQRVRRKFKNLDFRS